MLVPAGFKLYKHILVRTENSFHSNQMKQYGFGNTIHLDSDFGVVPFSTCYGRFLTSLSPKHPKLGDKRAQRINIRNSSLQSVLVLHFASFCTDQVVVFFSAFTIQGGKKRPKYLQVHPQKNVSGL